MSCRLRKRTPVVFCEGGSWFSTPLSMNILDWLVFPSPEDENKGVSIFGQAIIGHTYCYRVKLGVAADLTLANLGADVRRRRDLRQGCISFIDAFSIV